MQLLAPFILLVGLSTILYKTAEVWSKSEYDLQKVGASPAQAKDVTVLRQMVNRGEIAPVQADQAFQQKYGQVQAI